LPDQPDDTTPPRPVTDAALGSAQAPFVYFDGVATYGIAAGAIQLELVAHAIVPTSDNQTRTDTIVVAHLRCSPAAAMTLRRALDGIELMTTPPEGPSN
jgi:hypothetical protein